MGIVFHIVGTNHKHMALAGREKLASGSEVDLAILERARTLMGATECALLSTCNRIELYFAVPSGHTVSGDLAALFDPRPKDAAALSKSIYHYCGDKAIDHLFRVTCGLDSMVLGEHEIVSQVKSALSEALESGHAGAIMTRLFNQAMRVGKRARRETAISSGIFSVGQCAARLAQENLGELSDKRILLLGAGRIAKVTAKHLTALGAGPINVFSRTRERAQELADMLEAHVVTSEELPRILETCDILVGCASAPHHLVGPEELLETTRQREGRPLVVIDLGVPRNVDPEVAKLPGIRLFNIDDLEKVVDKNVDARKAEIMHVEEIIAQELHDFQSRENNLEVKAVIAKLREKFAQIRCECLSKAACKQMTEEERATFDYLTDLLARKLLHQPTIALKEACADREEADMNLAAAVVKLFDLDCSDVTTPGQRGLPESDKILTSIGRRTGE